MAGKALLGGGSSGRTSAVPVKQTKIPSSAFRQTRPTTQKIPKTSPLGGYGIVVSGGSLPKNAFLMPQVSGGAGGDTLEETNNILFDIRKLLVFDFNSRINKEKQQVQAIKNLSDKEQRERKESTLEAFKGVQKITSNVGNRIIAPFQNPLAAVFGFLKNVLAGFVANKSLKWLSENKDKVKSAFDWFRDNWEGVKNTTLNILSGVLLLDIAGKLFKVYMVAKSFIDLFRGNKAPSGGRLPNQGPGARVQGRNPGFRSPGRYRSPGQARSGGSFRMQQARQQLTFGKTPSASAVRNAQAQAPGIISKMGPLRGLGKVLRILGLGFLAAELYQDIRKGDFKAVAVKLTAYGLGWLTTTLVAAAGFAIAGTGVGIPAGLAIALGSMAAGGAVDYGVRKAFGYNRGGIIPGGGPDRDSRLIAATPGEYIINRKNTNRFLPFLDDINYSGGALYSAMYKSLKEQDKNADSFAKTNKRFDKVLNDYKKVIEKKGGSSGSISGSSSGPKITSPAMNTSGGLQPKSGEGSTGMVSVAPLLKNSQSDGGAAAAAPAGGDSIPVLGATDLSNPYIAYVMKEYGIIAGS